MLGKMQERLEHFPVSFFSIVMGLAGLTISLEKMQQVLDFRLYINGILVVATIAVFAGIAWLYLKKFRQHPEAVRAELMHPIKLNFFPAISISLLLISVTLLPVWQGLAAVFWLAGAMLHFLFTLFVVNLWVNHQHFEVHHINPAWFIPAVGNVIVPVTGSTLGFIEVSWFFFSVGMLFWLILLTLIFNRVMFHNPLPEKMLPTLFILIAPPAVGFISYVKLTGDIDSFARILYYVALFFTFFLATQLNRFTHLPFFLSWWAYSFPLAAITIATWAMYEYTHSNVFFFLAILLQIVVTAVVGMLLKRTWGAVQAEQVCLPE